MPGERLRLSIVLDALKATNWERRGFGRQRSGEVDRRRYAGIERTEHAGTGCPGTHSQQLSAKDAAS
jgi:hypothetical protein